MKIQRVEGTDRHIVLKVTDVHVAVLNAIRRTLVSDVPKLAIEEVTIYDNNSALFDEMVAHRLGLLPIPTDPKAFSFRDECTCAGEGCPNCTVLMTLTAEGPSMVYSKQLQPTDPSFTCPEPNVPITMLEKNQRVMLEATAVLGRGSDHTKFCPVVACGYEPWPTVKVTGPLTLPAAQRRELQTLLSRDAVEIADNGTITIVDEVKAAVALRAAHGMYDLDNVEFGSEADTWRFHFETDGALTPKVALQTAIGILMEKLRGVEETVPELKLEA